MSNRENNMNANNQIPGAVYDEDGCCIKAAMTPIEFMELFALAFQRGCGTSRDHLLFRVAENARDSAFQRGLEHGRKEGYGKAIHDMELSQHKGQDFVRDLINASKS